MRDHDDIGTAPNYSTPALIMGWVNLMWILMVIWAEFGFVAALLLTAILNHALARWQAVKAGR